MSEEQKRNNPSHHQPSEEEDTMLWRVLVFGLIGASATTIAVSRLRGTVDWVYSQLTRMQSGRNFGTSFREEAFKRYNQRMREEYEDEMERLERIRRMQSVFNRQRHKYQKEYESWTENGRGAYHQHSQRNDWYWKADTTYREQGTHFKESPRANSSYPLLSHHYSVLGLQRLRAKPYTDDEIKTAFRAKAMEFHPDQNQDKKEFAEAKFKEVMRSYEAIKLERKNDSSR
ncbi:unnamed protein product [Cuscuta epithymum]|uniref:J domain-containing protein n=1 Tax=Cuscuta epithymum TaxID=186058 RepID=A0AAV0ECI4_9ASTE|nr:unnamed protein product [Cuscuta epithymum]